MDERRPAYFFLQRDRGRPPSPPASFILSSAFRDFQTRTSIAAKGMPAPAAHY